MTTHFPNSISFCTTHNNPTPSEEEKTERMDIKAMAKSKRSHTQHNQPRKPQHHAKPTSSSCSTSSTTKPSGSKAVKKDKKGGVNQQQPSLPSNWDRYDSDIEEEEEQEQEIPIHRSDSGGDPSGVSAGSKAKKVVEGVERKSKGADFGNLIAQAKESQLYRSVSPSFDDALPDFYQGLVPLLAIKGEGITEWDRDDNFLLEGEANTVEAPFMTLDLKAITEEVSKVDLAKRLFIEPDLLPLELSGQNATAAENMAPSETQGYRKHTVETFADLYSVYLEDEKLAETLDDTVKENTSSSHVSSSGHPYPMSAADAVNRKFENIKSLVATGKPLTGRPSGRDSKIQFDYSVCHVGRVNVKDTERKSDDLGFPESTNIAQVKPTREHDNRPSSSFVANASESKLGTLPRSSTSDSGDSQSKIVLSMNEQGTPELHLEGDSRSHGALLQHSLGASSPVFPLTSSLDDELDDLLQETSKTNNRGNYVHSVEVQTASTIDGIVGAPSRSLGTFPITSSLDDELDNLLEETSKPIHKDSLLHSTQTNVATSGFPCSSSSPASHPSSKSEVLDDFDSWLDTL